jgi:hypothetical protein
MVGNVYSNYELAKEMAEEKMREIEQDVFICHSKYQSGEEFVLKTRDQLSCNSYLYMVSLPFKHRFANKQNAEREAGIFASKKGRPVYVKPRTYIQNGYKKIKHYYLTYKEPCST